MDPTEKITTLIGEENRGTVPLRYLSRVQPADAGGGGDCFYYSIHDALMDSGLKDRVDAQFGTAGMKEDFVRLFRNVIAQHADVDLSTLYQETCHTRVGGDYDNRNTFVEFLKTTRNPDWLNRLLYDTFYNYDSRRDGCLTMEPGSVEVKTFVRQGKAAISTRKNWAGQLEVSIAKRLLEPVGVYLDIKNHLFVRLLNIENRITLYNIDEGHFQYFRRVEGSARSIDDTFSVVSEGRPLLATAPATAPAPVPVTPAAAPAATKTPANVKPVTANAKPVTANVKPKVATPGPKSPTPKPASTKTSRNRTQKIQRQARRVQAAYQYVLDEVKKFEAFLATSE